jgi:catechol 2,3-dioxygenase-like lactoylglutathione lyase family enzyme
VIQHASLETRRDIVDAELAFWALLGFERVDPPGGLAERSAWAQRAGTLVHLLFEDDPVVQPEGHVAVVADDYAATIERLEAAGFEVEPRPQHWGSPRAFVRSPQGHRVEVMASPPVVG